MSDWSTSPSDWNWTPGQVPPAIQGQIERLRTAIRRTVWVSGLSKMVLIGLAVLLVDFLLDYFFHMDQSQRGIMVGLMVGSFIYSAYHFLWLPLKDQISDDALVLTVEQKLGRRHNELISTLQFAREAAMASRGYSPVMAQQVVKQGAKLASEIDFLQAVDQTAVQRRQRWLWGGWIGVLVWAVMVLGTDAGWLWFQRNLLLANTPWPTRVRLSVDGVVDGVLYVPRGEDHRLLVKVDPESKDLDIDVFLDFVGRSSSTRQKLRRDDQEPLEHTTTLRGVNSEFAFQVRGGDYVSDPIQIQLVQPPGFKELQLTVTPPAYSGLEESNLPLSAESFRILVGSQLRITATADQPATRLALLRGEQRWEIPADSDGSFQFQLEGAALVSGRYQFDLSDEAGIRPSRPVQFSLDVVADRAPEVRTRAFGISNLVVPQAIVPVTIAIQDEFKITDAWAELTWEADGSPTRGNRRLALAGKDEATLSNEWTGSEGFDLLPLEIPTGMTLQVVIKAQDNQPAPTAVPTETSDDDSEDRDDPAGTTTQTPTQPGVGAGKPIVLRVVTEAELRADLLRRELEQTKTFERLIAQQQAVLTEIQALAVSQQEKTETPESFLIRQTQMSGKSVRNQHQVGTLLTQVTDRFRGFLAEVRNNRLDESSSEIDGGQGLAIRLEQQIIQPLDEIDQTLLPELNRNMEWVSRSVGQTDALDESIAVVVPQMEEVLQRLAAVLDAMQRSQSFQEIVNMVISIKNEEQRLKKMAEDKKRAESGLDEIFDQ